MSNDDRNTIKTKDIIDCFYFYGYHKILNLKSSSYFKNMKAQKKFPPILRGNKINICVINIL